MVRVLLATVVALAALGRFAYAAPMPNEPKWSDFFDGDDSQLGADWGGSPSTGRQEWRKTGQPLPFKSWIRGSASCMAEIDQIFTAIQDYDQTYRRGDDKKAQRIFANLQSDLGRVRPECAATAGRALWVAIALLGPNDKVVEHRNNIALFTVFLANHDVFSYLTPEMRKGLAKGAKSIWTEKRGKDYVLSGVYSCQDSKVYLSSTLRPYNLFASLLHELDHLYRDKIGYQLMKSWREKADIKAFLTTDELYATLYAAFYQADFKMDIATGAAPPGDEFSAFKTGGPLAKLVAITHEWQPISFPRFIGTVKSLKLEEPSAHESLCTMDQLIRKGYFGSVSGQCNFEFLFPKAAWITFENYLSGFVETRRDPAKKSEFLQELREISNALRTVTPPCQRMVEAQAKGELDQYIGSRIKDAPSRPGNAGIKPCLRIAL